MPSLITRRGTTRWRGRVQVNGTVRTKMFPDDSRRSEKAAIAWEDKTRAELLAKANETPSVSFVTPLEWATKYLEHSQKVHAPKVFEEKRRIFARLLQSGLVDPEDSVEKIHPGVALAHITAQKDAVLFKKKKGKLVPREAPRGGNAANKDRKTLCAAWKWAGTFIKGFPVGVNPWQVTPKMPEERSPRYIPPISDFWQIIDMLEKSDEIADQQDRVMLMTLLHTAGRRNEIFNLKVFDIDERRIRLWTRKRDGGNHEANWIPLTPTLKGLLSDWIKTRPVKGENVFVILKNTPGNERFYGQPFTNRQHFMRRICKRAKVKPFGFHAIRHLSASVLWNEGIDIKDVQLILRHMSQATTERYLHRLGLLQPTGDRIGAALERGGKVIELPTARSAER